MLDDPAESPVRKKKQKGKSTFLRPGGAYVTWSGGTFRAPMPKLSGKKQFCGAFYRAEKGCKNPDCEHLHLSFADMTPAQRKIMTEHVARTELLEFTEAAQHELTQLLNVNRGSET